MASFPAQLYKLGGLGTAVYGSANDWHQSLNRTIDTLLKDNTLERAVNASSPAVSAIAEYGPYVLLAFLILEGGAKIIDRHKGN